jgi:cell division protein FtsZ
MRSIITEALERHKFEKIKAEKIGDKIPQPSVSPDDEELKKIVEKLHISIKIIGCGGGGCNTINRCWEEGVSGACMCATNTDAPHLLSVHADRKILIGRQTTKGRGAGAIPKTGEEAIRENEEDIRRFVAGSDMVFITAGMGGGTGTGAAPFIAKLAKDAGALTMGIVTLPFKSEGTVRMQNAEYGLQKLASICDTTITIPNDKLLEFVPNLPVEHAFKVADEILMTCIKGITEIITKPGLVNIDYSDITTVMKDGGVAYVGLGESEAAQDKVVDAVNMALDCPLLGDIDISEATGVLVRVTGGPDMTVAETEHAVRLISTKVNPMAKIIWGCTIDPTLDRSLKVLLVVTGVKSPYLIGRSTGAYYTTLDKEDIDMVK